MSNFICADKARSLIQETVGRLYAMEAPEMISGTCSVCGATNVQIVEPRQGDKTRGSCLAQFNLNRARPGHSTDGALTHFTPVDPSKAPSLRLIYMQNRMLITPKRAIVVANVAPTRELPASVEVYRVSETPPPSHLLAIILDPSNWPFFYAEYDKKTDMPMLSSARATKAYINGGNIPLPVDFQRVARLVEIRQTLGPKTFVKVAIGKKALAQGKPGFARGRFPTSPTKPVPLRDLIDLAGGEEAYSLIPTINDPLIEVVRNFSDRPTMDDAAAP